VSTIDKPPSAELRPDQKDEDSLPPYDKLDRMLELFLEYRKTAEEIAEDVGVPASLAKEIITKVYRNEFKRKQFPPTLRVSRKAWVGRVFPIVQRFSE
jgi:NAD+ synthase (glutamine-hydrolysing)